MVPGMNFLESVRWKIFQSPRRDRNDRDYDASPFETPPPRRPEDTALPSGASTLTNSAFSSSTSSTLWQSPPSAARWSQLRILPPRVRNKLTKRQIAVLVFIGLSLLVWAVPLPFPAQGRVIHLAVPHSPFRAHHALRSYLGGRQDAAAPDVRRWLARNSDDRHAVAPKRGLLGSVRAAPGLSTRPRAALISLVRNSELPGIAQSMRQLEYRWNRKYQYPWIFFNDEPFSDEFKVSAVFERSQTTVRKIRLADR